jgi:hypothetical protein
MKRNLQVFIALLSFVNILLGQTYPPSCIVTMPYSNAYFKTGTDVEIHVYATDIGKSTNNGTTKLGEATLLTNCSTLLA